MELYFKKRSILIREYMQVIDITTTLKKWAWQGIDRRDDGRCLRLTRMTGSQRSEHAREEDRLRDVAVTSARVQEPDGLLHRENASDAKKEAFIQQWIVHGLLLLPCLISNNHLHWENFN